MEDLKKIKKSYETLNEYTRQVEKKLKKLDKELVAMGIESSFDTKSTRKVQNTL